MQATTRAATAVGSCATRTGAQSYWFKGSKTAGTQFPVLQSSSDKYDVVVIGGGITGLSTALCLADAGIKRIAVLDALQIGKGVTGYSTAKITSQHNLIYADLEKKFGEKTATTYAELNQFGVQHISDTIKKYNIECDFSHQDAYTYTQQESYVDSIKKEAETASKCGIPASFTVKTSLPFNILGAVRFDNQAQFNGYDYCVGLANALSKRGVEFYENSRVVDVDHIKSPHSIKTDSGATVTADYAVLATHIPFLDRSGHFGFVEPVTSYVVAYKGAPGQKFPEGMYISAEEPKMSVRSADNGNILIVGGEGHPLGEAPEGNNENAVKNIEKWTATNFGQLEKLCSWMAHDYRPPDHLPYIGYLHRGCTSIFCATGFMKWGISLGAASGRLITDLIVNKDEKNIPTRAWLDAVDSRRWDLTHSVGPLAKFQAHVGKHLVGDKIKAVMSPMDIEDLANGKGGICKTKQDGQIAAYRDENGQLIKLSPVCTHLGCHVNWNQNDRTWDCPCHGSRYNFDGNVIHGPAVHPLKKVEA